MAQVFLPMGYPIQTGVEFDVIVYQGNLVRSYTLPSDPRVESQLFQRKFLSDFTKMRRSLGLWGKGSCRAAMGSTWGSVLYQAIKADIYSWWSDALASFDGLDNGDKEGWRNYAPYQATFNDPGRTFFAMARVIHYALEQFGGFGWLAPLWSGGDYQSAFEWWTDSYYLQVMDGTYDDHQIFIRLAGDWGTVERTGAYGGFYKVSDDAEGQTIEIGLVAKRAGIGFIRENVAGSARSYWDGVAGGLTSFHAFEEQLGLKLQSVWRKRSFHVFKWERLSGRINFDFVQVE